MFIPMGSSVWYTVPVTRHSRIGGCVAVGNGRYFSRTDNKGCYSNARKIRQAAVWLAYCTKDVYAGISAKDDRQRVAK